MRKNRMKKWIGILLAMCLAVGLLPTTAMAEPVVKEKFENNPAGNTLNELAQDYYMSKNEGTVTVNNGDIYSNYGTIAANNGTVQTNFGTVTSNNGTVKYNCGGTVTDGTVVHDYIYTIDLSGIANNENFYVDGDNETVYRFSDKAYVKENAFITLRAYDGYKFTDDGIPKITSGSGTITDNGDGTYTLTGVTGDISLFAAVAHVPVTDITDLWVGGVQVTSANKDDITAAINTATPGAASGSASFDPATNTLVLNGFSYEGAGHKFGIGSYMGGDESAAVYSELETLNITAYNANSLKHNVANQSSHGIYTIGNLVITGESSGTLTAAGCATNTARSRSVGIFVEDKDITVNGGMLIGNGGDTVIKPGSLSTGIWCLSGDITVNDNGQLIGSGGSGNTSRGICMSGKLIVNGGTVNGTGGTGGAISHGISVGSLESSSETSRISGTGGSATARMSTDESVGIVLWNESGFSKGQITGVAGEAPAGKSFGILNYDQFTIGGGTVIAQGTDGAFNNLPIIDSGFSDAGIWYGDTEAEADASGAKRKSVLAANYTQKYVRISYADLPPFDVAVTPAHLSLTEGKIHKDPDAKLTASYIATPEDTSVSYAYQWYACDEDGNNRSPIYDNESDGLDHEYWISEELAQGTYYYLCEVTGYDIDGNPVEAVLSNVVKVNVSAGTPVVIFDPDFGSFAEIGRVTIELPISNGKITGDVPRPAAEGFVFKGWYTKDGELISDPASHTFTHTTRLYARYSKIYTVTVAARPVGVGTVTGGGTYVEGDTVTVIAEPIIGYRFVEWRENGSKVSTDKEYTFEAERNIDLVAVFESMEYVITEGANQTWSGKGKLSFTIDNKGAQRIDVAVGEKDGDEVKILKQGLLEDYDSPVIYDGKDHIELFEKYLNTLAPGDYELIIKYEDGYASTYFTVSDVLDDVPDTGDDSHIGLWMGLMMIALAGLCACTVLYRKRKQER